MLKKLEIENFKAFSKFVLTCRDFNLLIGENNNGKSALIDALKLVSISLSYKIYRNPVRVPPIRNREYTEGFILPPERVPFSLYNLRNEYREDEVTLIRAFFDDQLIVTVVFPMNDNDCYFYFLSRGVNITNSRSISANVSERLGVIPPLGAFDENEPILVEKYVKRSYGTALTPRHFRNIWRVLPDGFEEFAKSLQETWEGIRIQRPEISLDQIGMYYLEDRITREISWAGTGLMVWMQLLTHITKLGNFSTIVLDEPDIYLHSDLQRKLIHMLEQMKSQVILTSHSVELINEVNPEDIVYIDKKLPQSRNLNDISEVQACVNQLGSAQNIQISELIRSRKCLIVEGKDFKTIKRIAAKLGYESLYDEKHFAVVKLEGFSNCERLKDSRWYFENVIGERIEIFVILDSDYYSKSELNELRESFRRNNVHCHIWEKKELENYLLDPDLLYRSYLSEAKRKKAKSISSDEFSELLTRLTADFYNDVFAQRLSHRLGSAASDPKQVKQFKDGFDKNWKNMDYRLKVIGGKDYLSRLNSELMNSFKLSITTSNILRHMRKDEIDPELVSLIKEVNKAFGMYQ